MYHNVTIEIISQNILKSTLISKSIILNKESGKIKTILIETQNLKQNTCKYLRSC